MTALLKVAKCGLMTPLMLLSIQVVMAPTKPISSHVVLLVDCSGSMGWSNLGATHSTYSQALGAAGEVLRQPTDELNVKVVAWSDQPTLCPLTTDWLALPDAEAVQKVEEWLGSLSTQGCTNLTPALKYGQTLTAPDGKPVTLIVVTDGDLSSDTEKMLLDALSGSVTVGVWQVGSMKPTPKLKALAKKGGGGYVRSGAEADAH